MAKSCPDCGAEVEYRSRAVEVLEGTCASCGHASVVVAPAAEGSAPAAAASAGSAPSEAPCWECGAALAFTVHPDHSVDAVCEACGTTTRLSAASDEGEEEGETEEEGEEGDEDRPARPRFSDRRPAKRPGGWSDRRGPRRDSGPADRPPARPCRQCGGALEFTQNDDGTVTGTCRSCGNTFTMQRREDRPRSGYDRRPSWGGRSRFPSGGARGERRYGRPRSDEDDRPRRRRRDD